ncbi:hypothetical protein [Nereida ignava]|uniref:hypothetical protein n=1 Tax=Nereida ignava TaxID=282199 RepID=UPI0030FBA728
MTVLDKPLALVPVEERSETESESADESAARPTTPVRGAMPVAALVERADAAQRPADRDVLDYASDDSEVEKLEPPRAWPRSDECTLLRPFVCARQDFGVQQDAAQRPPDSDGTESESSEDEEPRPTPPPKKRSRPEEFEEDRETRRDRHELQRSLVRILYRTERVYKALRPIVRETTRADLQWLIEHTRHGIDVASCPEKYAASATAQAMRGLRD